MADEPKKEAAGAAAGKLKKPLTCWELPAGADPETGARVRREYQAGDAVPGHLRQHQLERLREQGVI